MSVQRELHQNTEKELLTKKTKEIYRNYPGHEIPSVEILEVEFITLLVTLTISFMICAALTYSLILVSVFA